jgi:hypothetical protein
MFPEMSNFLSPPAKPGDYLCIYMRWPWVRHCDTLPFFKKMLKYNQYEGKKRLYKRQASFIPNFQCEF